MPNNIKSARVYFYRFLVLVLLLSIAAAVAYNYYQAALERAAFRRQLNRIERLLKP